MIYYFSEVNLKIELIPFFLGLFTLVCAGILVIASISSIVNPLDLALIINDLGLFERSPFMIDSKGDLHYLKRGEGITRQELHNQFTRSKE